MFNKPAASYISPVSMSFVLFLLYVSYFGYIFASLLCGGNLIHHHLRTRGQYPRQKDENKAERCCRVAS